MKILIKSRLFLSRNYSKKSSISHNSNVSKIPKFCSIYLSTNAKITSTGFDPPPPNVHVTLSFRAFELGVAPKAN